MKKQDTITNSEQPNIQSNRKHSILEEKDYDEIQSSLTNLYRMFQDEYVENPEAGKVSVVSNSHIVCNGSEKVKLVTLPELYTYESPAVQEIRIIANLLPYCAKFFILHYPHIHDVFVIEWKDGPKKPYKEKGPASTRLFCF